MRQDHMDIFFRVAESNRCWIGLREPNPLADQWIGRAGFTPKPMSCKAKTADNESFEFAGLVAHPEKCKSAFSAATVAEARRKWGEFSAGGRLPSGYTLVETGREAGLVKLHGAFIYADFDLMAILAAGDKGEFLETSQARQRDLFERIKPDLNQGLRAPMIQHGAEFMWDQGVGARESEYVLWFGPNRGFNRWPSSMPKGGH